MACHEDRIEIAPSSVVSRISSVEIPSTPKKYCTPMPGIQGAFSWNWKPVAARSKRNQSGRLTTNPSRPKMFATQRTASSLRLNAGTASSTRAPTSGVNVMTLRRWSWRRFIRSSSQDPPLPEPDHEQDHDQHRQRVVLDQAVLQRPEHVGEVVQHQCGRVHRAVHDEPVEEVRERRDDVAHGPGDAV